MSSVRTVNNIIPLVKTRKGNKRKSKSSVERLQFHINRIRKYAKKYGLSEENNSGNDYPNLIYSRLRENMKNWLDC